MIRTAVVLSALLVAGTAGAALAQSQSEFENPVINGTVQSLDPASRTVVFDNGQSYTLSETTDMETLSEGSTINLACEEAKDHCIVVSSATQNDLGPEFDNEPSAGTAEGAPTVDAP